MNEKKSKVKIVIVFGIILILIAAIILAIILDKKESQKENGEKEIISGEITQKSRDKLQNLLLSGTVNSTQMAWL
jgi:uncharacterized protein YpmB